LKNSCQCQEASSLGSEGNQKSEAGEVNDVADMSYLKDVARPGVPSLLCLQGHINRSRLTFDLPNLRRSEVLLGAKIPERLTCLLRNHLEIESRAATGIGADRTIRRVLLSD
jgi:hypothetical protein